MRQSSLEGIPRNKERLDRDMDHIFQQPAVGDTSVSGLSGSSIHVHETPFGCGVITDQSVPNGQGRHVQTFNRFNSEVDRILSQVNTWKE